MTPKSCTAKLLYPTPPLFCVQSFQCHLSLQSFSAIFLCHLSLPSFSAIFLCKSAANHLSLGQQSHMTPMHGTNTWHQIPVNGIKLYQMASNGTHQIPVNGAKCRQMTSAKLHLLIRSWYPETTFLLSAISRCLLLTKQP